MAPAALVKPRSTSSMLMAWHNLHYYQELMAGLRGTIGTGTLPEFTAAFHAEPVGGDLEPL